MKPPLAAVSSPGMFNSIARWTCAMFVVGFAISSQAEMAVKDLRCEYKVNPLGIDVLKPRLSWVLTSDERGQKQTACQILVASSEETLDQNRGDLWDSGKIQGDQTNQIPYSGSELRTGEECFWKVRVWDGKGNESDYSEPARWEMGILAPLDAKAMWIEANPTMSPKLDFQGAWWIWYPDGFPSISAPAGKRYFRRQVDLPKGKKILKATMLLTVDDGFTFYTNGKPVFESIGVPDDWKTRKEIDLTEDLHPGVNTIAVAAINENGAGGKATPAGMLGKLVVEVEGSDPVVVVTDKEWKASAQKADGWEKPDFVPNGWADAMQVAGLGQLPWGDRFGVDTSNRPPYLRTQFKLTKELKRARLYATALGLYDFSINGQPVGDAVIKPDWDNYHIRVQYQTFDVTKLLHEGDNALGAILGPGWYSGHVGMDAGQFYGVRPALLAHLQLEFADGSTEVVISDKSWKWAYGPLIRSDLLDGEDYDARQATAGWDKPGFDDSKWNAVSTRTSSAKTQAQIGPPIRRMAELACKKVAEPQAGRLTFDLGQNMVGWIRLKVNGAAGTRLTMRYAEMLNPDGTIYTANLRNAKATDTYTLKGGGEETWEPHFTFHGFRYVETTGFPGKLSPEAVTGIVVHSDTPRVGHWECSNAQLNQLYSNILWGQWGNFLSIPTDCPQRDERLGWMGDAQVFVRTATCNADVASFFTKWLLDVSDAQSPTGAYTDVSPRACCGEGTAAWADAGVICPWTIWQVYNDKRLVDRQYESMAKYIEYLKSHSKDLIRPAEGYGDWLSIAADTPKDVLATGYFAYSTHLMAQMARAIGKEDDAKKYESLFDDIKAAFNKAFVAEDGRIKGNTQTCYAIALKFDLLPEDKQAKAAQYLVDDIKARGMH
ncbi:MAG TPA: family 78 glycoside hydrolase catalytic domain, partial [Tepidisphaeraceae bacterium]